MSLEGLNNTNSKIQNDHPKYSKLSKNTVTLDNIFDNHFYKTLLEYLICDNCSSIRLETINTSLNMYHKLK